MTKSKGRTTKKYLEDYDGAPYDLDEFATGAEEVNDNDSLKKSATEFLRAKEVFEQELEKIGLEMG
jgi:hypothetical protein